ncbi:MAG: hypothetical protein QNK37_36675 [Acidobacteriota bacterium]|nr:hypothetical protein [Acidobacteriota bacterium]
MKTILIVSLSSILLFGAYNLQPVNAASCSTTIMCENLGGGWYQCWTYPGGGGTYSWSATNMQDLGSPIPGLGNFRCYPSVSNAYVSVTHTNTSGCTAFATRRLSCGSGGLL